MIKNIKYYFFEMVERDADNQGASSVTLKSIAEKLKHRVASRECELHCSINQHAT